MTDKCCHGRMTDKCRHERMTEEYSSMARAVKPAPQASDGETDSEVARLRLQVEALLRVLERREAVTSGQGAIAALALRLGVDVSAPADVVVSAAVKALDDAEHIAALARSVVAADQESRRSLVRLRVALRGGR